MPSQHAVQSTIAYTKKGWEQMIQMLGAMSAQDQQDVVDFLDSADVHSVTDSGAHLFYFSNVYAGDPGSTLIGEIIALDPRIDTNEFYFLAVDTVTGDTDSLGQWRQNEFQTAPTHGIKFHSFMYQSGCGIDLSKPASTATPQVPVIVNDHTCGGCGNTRCSKSEKSCWACGHPI